MLAADLYAWQPLPEPTEYEYTDWAEVVEKRLTPEQPQLTFEPARLSVTRIEVIKGTGNDLQFFRRVKSSHGEIQQEIDAVPITDNAFVFFSYAERPATVVVRSISKEKIRVRVDRLTTRASRVYWDWWFEKMLDVIDGKATAPETLPVAEFERASRDVKDALFLMKVLNAYPDVSNNVRDAARDVVKATLWRAVATNRRPYWKFHSKRSLAKALDQLPATTVTIDGDREKWHEFQNEVPAEVTLTGPRVAVLEVRALKDPAEPDALSRFALSVQKRGVEVHRDDFTSRAAFEENDTEEDAQNAPGSPVEETTPVTDATGRVVGWRRSTQFWVPPGTHNYQLVPTGRMLIRGESYLVRPVFQTSFQKPAIERWLINADKLLAGENSSAAQIVRLELYGIAQDFLALKTTKDSLEEVRGDDPIVDAWLDWTVARWVPDAEVEPDAITRHATQGVNDEFIGRLTTILARTAIRRGEPRRAAHLLSKSQGSVRSVEERIIRQQVLIRLSATPQDRWAAVHKLFKLFEERPLDKDVRKAAQSAWWYATFWNQVPVPRGKFSVPRMQPVEDSPGEVYLKQYEDSQTILYRLRGPNTLRTRRAIDREDRLANVKLYALRNTSERLAKISIGEKQFTHVSGFPYSLMTFGVTAGESFKVENLSPESFELFSRVPPQRATMPSKDVVTRYRYRKVDDGWFEFQLDREKSERTIRIRVLPTEANQTSNIRLEDGTGKIQSFLYRGPDNADAVFSTNIITRVAAGVEAVRVRSEGAPVLLVLEQREVKTRTETDLINVKVALPSDEKREREIAEISRRLRSADNPTRADDLIRRATLLMSLDRDKYARNDLESALQETMAEDRRLYAEGLLEAAKYRTSSRWLEMRSTVPVEPFPTRLNVAPFPPATLAEDAVSLSCRFAVADPEKGQETTDPEKVQRTAVAEKAQETTDPEKAQRTAVAEQAQRTGCRLARAVADAETAETVESEIDALKRALSLWQNPETSWLISAELARALSKRIETDPKTAPVGFGASAYLHGRNAIEQIAHAVARSARYAGLRWSAWKSVRIEGPYEWISFEGDPSYTELNPVSADIHDEETSFRVALATSGLFWDPDTELIKKVFGDSRRTAFLEPPFDGTVEVNFVCTDLRPDLQPENVSPSCGLKTTMTVDGTAVGSNPIEGNGNEGGRLTVRFPVKKGARHKLVVVREDDTIGRFVAVRYRLLPTNGKITKPTLVPTQRFNVLSQNPQTFSVAGPTVLRLDGRPFLPTSGTRIRAVVTSPSSQVEPYELVLPDGKDPVGVGRQNGAAGEGVRREIVLPEEGVYTISLTADQNFALVRAAVRVDRYERQIREAGRGWGVPAVEVSIPLDDSEPIEGVAALLLDQDDPSETPVEWAVGGTTGYRTRDVLPDEDELAANANAHSLIAAYGWVRPLQLPLWFRNEMRIQATFKTPIVFGNRFSATWVPGFQGLRLDLFANLYGQSSERYLVAGRQKLEVTKSTSLGADFLNITKVSVTLRQSPELPLNATEIDPVIASRYAIDHPWGSEISTEFRYRVFRDAFFYAEIRDILNPTVTIDQIRIRTGGVSLLGKVFQLSPSYEFRWLVNDRGRLASAFRHEFDIRGSALYWLTREHRLDVTGWTTFSLLRTTTRVAAGLQFSYIFTPYSIRPETPARFDTLLEPEYFDAKR